MLAEKRDMMAEQRQVLADQQRKEKEIKRLVAENFDLERFLQELEQDEHRGLLLRLAKLLMQMNFFVRLHFLMLVSFLVPVNFLMLVNFFMRPVSFLMKPVSSLQCRTPWSIKNQRVASYGLAPPRLTERQLCLIKMELVDLLAVSQHIANLADRHIGIGTSRYDT